MPHIGKLENCNRKTANGLVKYIIWDILYMNMNIARLVSDQLFNCDPIKNSDQE